ncbi:MAG: hypothetical protein GY862_29255 [Gammaproteobacteria bacterium]|nr:hypothetical protein [Gammaproteobacteria bacterium]
MLLVRAELHNTFCHWLDLYAATLFSRLNFRLWTLLSPGLYIDIEDTPNKLFQLVQRLESMKEIEIKDVADASALKSFSMLFPSPSHSAPDLESLPEPWQTCGRLAQEFREGEERIKRQISPTAEVEQVPDQFSRSLGRFSSTLPVFNNFDEAWRQAWLNELRRLRDRVFTTPKINPFGTEEAVGPVGRFFRVMGDAGCTCGRFYRIIEVPGCNGMLHLTYRDEDPQSTVTPVEKGENCEGMLSPGYADEEHHNSERDNTPGTKRGKGCNCS